ncbi:hypothetical protein AC1031_007717 [Aphanomyces cochlioides]|nr:hypothetical protein AC1031_007717 [Aphanomyces cochlioides]
MKQQTLFTEYGQLVIPHWYFENQQNRIGDSLTPLASTLGHPKHVSVNHLVRGQLWLRICNRASQKTPLLPRRRYVRQCLSFRRLLRDFSFNRVAKCASMAVLLADFDQFDELSRQA